MEALITFDNNVDLGVVGFMSRECFFWPGDAESNEPDL